jgi:hypothetical protein
VYQDGFDDLRVFDNADDLHQRTALGTHQGVHFVGLCFILHLLQ